MTESQIMQERKKKERDARDKVRQNVRKKKRRKEIVESINMGEKERLITETNHVEVTVVEVIAASAAVVKGYHLLVLVSVDSIQSFK